MARGIWFTRFTDTSSAGEVSPKRRRFQTAAHLGKPDPVPIDPSEYGLIPLDLRLYPQMEQHWEAEVLSNNMFAARGLLPENIDALLAMVRVWRPA